jgi:SEC-C motif-containing protein
MTETPAQPVPPRGEDPCPCGSGKTFALCCRPLLARERPAASAEELMRSRFTAHVVRDYAHLHRSYLKTANEPYDPADTPEPTAWTRLVVHSHEPGVKPDVAFVEFTAYFKEGEAERSFPERARFQRIDGVWFYAGPVREGPAPIHSTGPKVGRNDPCPCGSGKKHKQCCLRKA